MVHGPLIEKTIVARQSLGSLVGCKVTTVPSIARLPICITVCAVTRVGGQPRKRTLKAAEAADGANATVAIGARPVPSSDDRYATMSPICAALKGKVGIGAVGVAIAARLPNIALSANGGSAAPNYAQAFVPGAGFYTLGASVTAVRLYEGCAGIQVGASGRSSGGGNS